MKYFISTVFLALSFSVAANDCVTPAEYSAHYMGYLAYAERPSKPVLMWWRDEYDDEALEHDDRLIGVETLSKKRMFQSARKILRKKKADTYFIAWPDTINISDREIDVVKVSFAFSKDSPAYDGAFETIFKKSESHGGEMIATPIYFGLGCAANLIK